LDSTKYDPIITLKQSLVKEREYHSALCTINDNFYDILHQEMKNLKNKELQQISDILHEFVRIRHSKIIQFASVMELNHTIEDKLSVEEQTFYNNVNGSCKLFLEDVSKID
jgi:DNA replication initiation complex subunit (GINS family)